jgi:hypothetical protein
MPHWLIKSAIHRAISFLPRSDKWNEFLQTHVSKSLALGTGRFDLRLDYCRQHLEHFFNLRPLTGAGFSVLELGTGWYPIVPVGFYLCGATDIWTFDIAPLLRRSRVEATLQRFCEYHERGVLEKSLPWLRPERMARVREALKEAKTQKPEALLASMNIHALVRDASTTGLNSNSVDLFVSTSVLEYIPRHILVLMFSEFKRLSTPDAIMSHFINLLDEYCHFDKAITPFNFLKYSERQWKFLSSPLIWKNRLRISDYRDLLTKAGYEVTKELNTSGSTRELEQVPLAPAFRAYSQADLLVLRSWLVAKCRANA